MPQNQQETKSRNKREKRNIAGLIINIALIVAIVIAFFCTYTAYMTKNGSGVPDIFGYEPFSIQSESMSPFFEKGDLVIDKRVKDTSEIKEGDIITFWTIIDGKKVLNTHRVIEIKDGKNFRYFVTKGDNNTMEDSLTVHESEIVGIYHKHIKKLGTVLDFLQTSKGFFCIIVLPVFAFFLYYLVSFFRVLMEYQSEKKRLLYEQELVSQGRLNLEDVSPQAQEAIQNPDAEAKDDKQMKEVFHRFLEKHQGKPDADGNAGTVDQKKLEEQLQQIQAQMAQMQVNNAQASQKAAETAEQAARRAAEEAAQAAAAKAAQEAAQEAARLAAAKAAQAQQSVQPQPTAQAQQPVQPQPVPQTAANTAPQSTQQMGNDGNGITLTPEQLMALLSQMNNNNNNQAQQSVQPQPETPEKEKSGEDTISVSKSEFVDLLSLAMKKAKEEE